MGKKEFAIVDLKKAADLGLVDGIEEPLVGVGCENTNGPAHSSP